MPDDRIGTEDSTQQPATGLTVTRRSFLKKSAIAGAGVTAVYVAPQFKSVFAGPAYASATRPVVGGTWEELEPLQGEGFAGTVIGNRIYVSHGYRPIDSTRMDVYDIATDTWSPGAASPGGAASELVGAATGGRHYAIGGRNARTDVYSYDPGTDTWATEPFLNTARRGLGAAVIGTKIYAVGGSTGTGPGGGTPLAANEVLDTSAGVPAWAAVASMPTAAMGVYATVAFGGKVYVLGGYNSGAGGALGLVQIYDPATNSWSTGTSMPTPRSNALAGTCCDTHIHVIGGLDGSFFNSATHEVYTPSTDTWMSDVDYPVAAGGSEFAVGMMTHGSNIHVIGSGAGGLAGDRHFVYHCP